MKANIHFVTPNAKIKKENSIYSSNYNAICKNDCIKSSFFALGNTSAITVIYGNTAKNFVPYDVSFEQIKTARSEKMLNASKAAGVVIKTPKKEYTICLGEGKQ